jgi:hypothetical protein
MWTQRFRKPLFILALLELASCTPGIVNKQQAFDFSHPERIDLVIITQEPDALPLGINQQVVKNLQESGYPVGDKAGSAFSHTLTATVGLVTRGNTPTGFSYSSGNSDPRALEFQKMDVLPINCTLTAINAPEQSSELSMGFTASATDRRALDNAKLTDHISTVCFNVLREVKWPKPKPAEAPTRTQSSWLPEVQIETKETPVAAGATEEESNRVEEEPRKEIIIHNQGTPVILHFGHERR